MFTKPFLVTALTPATLSQEFLSGPGGLPPTSGLAFLSVVQRSVLPGLAALNATLHRASHPAPQKP